MAIFAISDLHLGFSVNKPMDIFGSRWENYTSVLKQNWTNSVCDDDIVLMPGDTSWGTYLKDSLEDFRFIDKLPGKKIITKGNHDYWWETLTKMNLFLKENNLKTIQFLHNSAILYENTAICGTKGYPDNLTKADDERLFQRELFRLGLSLDEARKLSPEKIIVMLHYPPDIHSEFAGIMKEKGVDFCIYGHLHAQSIKNAFTGTSKGIKYELVSCDRLNFNPVRIIL
ncbi:MAG: serine/threonine protein phosphatase [Ruminococcaceae bacterium]|nr:serine/threonine protein phosphatase [Oscillospiraceae bacterium]